MCEKQCITSLSVFPISDPKTICKVNFDAVSNPACYVVSHDGFGLALHGYHFLIGQNSSTASKSESLKFVVIRTTDGDYVRLESLKIVVIVVTAAMDNKMQDSK